MSQRKSVIPKKIIRELYFLYLYLRSSKKEFKTVKLADWYNNSTKSWDFTVHYKNYSEAIEIKRIVLPKEQEAKDLLWHVFEKMDQLKSKGSVIIKSAYINFPISKPYLKKLKQLLHESDILKEIKKPVYSVLNIAIEQRKDLPLDKSYDSIIAVLDDEYFNRTIVQLQKIIKKAKEQLANAKTKRKTILLVSDLSLTEKFIDKMEYYLGSEIEIRKHDDSFSKFLKFILNYRLDHIKIVWLSLEYLSIDKYVVREVEVKTGIKFFSNYKDM